MAIENELRRNNWVHIQIKGDRPHAARVVGLADGFIHTNLAAYIPTYEIRGIPLISEILLKAGFVLDNSGSYKLPFKVFIEAYIVISLHQSGLTLLYEQMSTEDPLIFYLSKKLEYLHEVQNLYFGLTGEDLKINL